MRQRRARLAASATKRGPAQMSCRMAPQRPLARRACGPRTRYGLRVPHRRKKSTAITRRCLILLPPSLKSGGGGLSETRTRDQRIKSPLLYRLSYQPDRSQKLWLISQALSKNRRIRASSPQQRRVRAAPRPSPRPPPPAPPPAPSAPKAERPLARPSCIGVTVLDYQAATTAPLNLVSMNCFTAGL